MLWLSDGEKCDYMFRRCDAIPPSITQTYGKTDKQTYIHLTTAQSALRKHRAVKRNNPALSAKLAPYSCKCGSSLTTRKHLKLNNFLRVNVSIPYHMHSPTPVIISFGATLDTSLVNLLILRCFLYYCFFSN